MNPTLDLPVGKIIADRDPRYDGQFYFGVRTTGIYCRTICSGNPKPENVTVLRSPTEAERLGFRACLRCHPDLAPGLTKPEDTEHIISRAIRILQTLSHEELDVKKLADAVGVTDRHLRRVFDHYLGASPVEVLITQRLHFAKQMIQETHTPITDIAFAVGFKSIRRFNEAFQERYHTPPSLYRKQRSVATPGPLTLKIPIRLPYDWAWVLKYLKRHETYGIEQVDGERYRRFIPRGKKFSWITVSYPSGKDYLTAEFFDVPLRDLRIVIAKLKNLLDTDHNPLHLPAEHQTLSRGIRVPGSFDPLETAISIILSQLVSTENAKLALKKLILRYGRKIGTYEGQEVFEFPSPRTLAASRIETLPKARARAIRELARDVLNGTIDFTWHRHFPEVKKRLLAIHGIGPWTAALIAMRCLNDADAFPEYDLLVQKALKAKFMDPAVWPSSRAYLTHHVWRDFKSQKEK